MVTGQSRDLTRGQSRDFTHGQSRDLTRGQSRVEACDLACLDQ